MRPRISIETILGRLDIELHSHLAVHSCNYFLDGVLNGIYEQCSFFRIVTIENGVTNGRPSIEVAQGGHCATDADIAPLIPHETTRITGLQHRRGTISLARFRPGAVYQSFFICFRDEPSLDWGGSRNADGLGFAAFGQVIDGWEVLDLLHQRAEPQELLQNPVLACIRLA